MKVSLEWLREFTPVRLPVAKLIDRMAMGGLEVVGVEKKGTDTVLEIEITPNRPDLLSHVGVAREIAALTGTTLKLPRPFLKTPRQKTGSPGIVIEDKKGCLRYIGRLLEGVRVGPSPSWLASRLERLGFRSINNVVDITNFILLEEGQPLHAFDHDKIAGGKLVIRTARRGEKLPALDEVTYFLEPGDLVIADRDKPVALAGIIGGKGTEVSLGTRRVLLESASFNPARVRRTAKRLGITTESSYRFERGVSLKGVARGSERAAELLIKETGAEQTGVSDLGEKLSPKRTISLSLRELEVTLGIACPKAKTKKEFIALGCRVSAGTDILRVTPPPSRLDLKEPVDLVEEAGRLLGYDRIPATVPVSERTAVGEGRSPLDPKRAVETHIKELLVSQGLFEVVTYSLLSRTLLGAFGADPSAIAIRNPVSLEQELMRPSLLPRLVEVAAFNHRRKVEGVPIFEVGTVYQKEGSRYRERKKVAILLSGKTSGSWRTQSTLYDYFDLKGRCEALVKAFHPSPKFIYSSVSAPFFSGPSQTLCVDSPGQKIGILGELSPSVLSFFDVKGKMAVAEIDLEDFIRATSVSKTYTPLPKHPSIRRDVALIVGEECTSEELTRAIREAGGEWVKDVSLFDTYSDPRIVPKGSRGLAYRIEFLHPHRTLTDEEVNEKYQAVLDALTQLGAQIRK